MTWQKRIDSLLHPALLAPGLAWRSRFLVECLVVGLSVSSVFGVVYALTGRGSLAVVTCLGMLGMACCVFALRWVRALEPVVWSAMLVCLGIFSLPALTESSLDPAVLAWAAIVPFVGALLLPPRQAVVSALVTAAAVLLMAVLRRGRSIEPPDEVLSIARVMAFVATVFVFGLRFSREQARVVSELGNANRAKSAFLATMSHEIRTPMNGVLGITEVLLSGPLDVDTREKLALVRQSGHTLVALVDDILDFSKVEAGKLKIEPVDFDVRLLVDDVAGLHRSAAKLKGVGLTVTIAPTMAPVVHGDALRLRQVLNNLVSNAVKFTERGEVRLTLEALLPGNRLRFTVADTGIGIAGAALGKLFAPFEQGDGSTTRRFGGTGLGLALSQNLVRLMGGQIAVESVVGVGSRFSFELPFELGVMALAKPPLEVQAPAQRSTLPVLVVDDNLINLKVACSLLEKAGYRTETAENGQVALDLVVKGRYLMVLMDCHMPVMDGFVATEQIRALDGEVGMTPVVALTASAMPEELEACKRAGMNDCLTKPVSLAALKSVLHRVEHYRGIVEGAA
jgi:signal transduction histidine kinase/ActR/RegA family two-component response regulator